MNRVEHSGHPTQFFQFSGGVGLAGPRADPMGAVADESDALQAHPQPMQKTDRTVTVGEASWIEHVLVSLMGLVR